jgi:hypothetical protein
MNIPNKTVAAAILIFVAGLAAYWLSAHPGSSAISQHQATRTDLELYNENR